MQRGVVLASDAGRSSGQLVDDLTLTASLGATMVRLDVPWARMQPRAGTIDEDVMESVLGAGLLARRCGLEPWFRLLQTEVPQWFDNEGGFTDARFAGRFWPRWVSRPPRKRSETQPPDGCRSKLPSRWPPGSCRPTLPCTANWSTP